MCRLSECVASLNECQMRRVCRGGMIELISTTEEQELLLGILEQRHRELQKEISHTDHHEFKLALRKKEKLLESVLSRLRGAPIQELRG